MDEHTEDWLPLKKAAARCGLRYQRLYKLYRRGVIRGRQLPSGQLQVDRAALEDHFPPPGWAWIHDVVKRYPLALYQVRQLVKQGRVQGRRRGRELQVELASLEEAIRQRAVPPGFLTIEGAAQRLGISVGHVFWLIRHGRLRAAWHGRRRIIPESSVDEYPVPLGCVTVDEAARWAGRTPRTIRRWIAAGRVAARKARGRWAIEEKALEQAIARAGDR